MLVALLATLAAHAGGIGLLGAFGGRTETVYYYDSSENFEQLSKPQLIVGMGAGVEFMLGDRDDRITGLFRAYGLREAPEKDPALTTDRDPGAIVANWREEPKLIGIGTFGVQWGILGDPNEWQFGVVTELGSGFLTPDHTEFLLIQGGPMFHYMIGPSLQLHAEVEYGVRMRKNVQHGAVAYVGARWLFD